MMKSSLDDGKGQVQPLSQREVAVTDPHIRTARTIPSTTEHLARDYSRNSVETFPESELHLRMTEVLGARWKPSALVGVPESEGLDARAAKAATAADVRAELNLEKWLPLSVVVSFASTLRLSRGLTPEYSAMLCASFEPNDEMNFLIRRLFDARDKRLEAIIARQNTDSFASIREIVANGIDASAGMPDPTVHVALSPGKYSVVDSGTGISPIDFFSKLLIPAISSKDGSTSVGRFGVGFFSCLAHVEKLGDRVTVTTKNGGAAFEAIFERRAEFEGELCVRVRPVEGSISKGTVVTVESGKLKPDVVLARLRRYFDSTTRAKVLVDGEALLKQSPRVSMSLPTRHGNVEISLLNSRVSDVRSLVAGIRVHSVACTLATGSRMVLDLPIVCSLPEGRDKVVVDKVFVEIMEDLIARIFERSELNTRDKALVANMLFEYLEHHRDPVVPASTVLTSQLRTQFFAHTDVSATVLLPVEYASLAGVLALPDPILLHHYFIPEFRLDTLPGVEICQAFDSRNAQRYCRVLIANLAPRVDRAIVKVRDNFILDRNTYLANSGNPELLNVYFKNLDPFGANGGKSVCGEAYLGRFVPYHPNGPKEVTFQPKSPREWLSAIFPANRSKNLSEGSPKTCRAVQEILERFPDLAFFPRDQVAKVLLDAIEIKVDPFDESGRIPNVDLDTPPDELSERNQRALKTIGQVIARWESLAHFWGAPAILELENIRAGLGELPGSSHLGVIKHLPVHSQTHQKLVEVSQLLRFANNASLLNDCKESALARFLFEHKTTIAGHTAPQLDLTVGYLSEAFRLSDEHFEALLPVIFDKRCLSPVPQTSVLPLRHLCFKEVTVEMMNEVLNGIDPAYHGPAYTFISALLPQQGFNHSHLQFARDVLMKIFSEHIAAWPVETTWSVVALAVRQQKQIHKVIGNRDGPVFPAAAEVQTKLNEVVTYVHGKFHGRPPQTAVPAEILGHDSYRVSVRLSHLCAARELKWGGLDAATKHADYEPQGLDAVEALTREAIADKDLEEFERTISHLINAQVVNEPWLWLRELAQNSVDALAESEATTEKVISVNSYLRSKDESDESDLVVAFRDPVGMTPSQVLNYLLLPNETTKAGKSELIGQFGQGFFTIFRGAAEVRVKTSIGDGNVTYVRFTLLNLNGEPLREGDRIGDLRIDLDVQKQPFKGTVINKDIVSPVAELLQRQLHGELVQKLSALSPSTVRVVYGSDLSREQITVNSSVYESRSVEVPAKGVLEVRFDGKDQLSQYGMQLKRFERGDRELWFDLPQEFIELLPRRMSIEIPRGYPQTRSRQGLVDYEEVVAELKPYLRTMLVRYLLEEFAAGKIPITSLMSYDFFSRVGKIPVPHFVQVDAQNFKESGSLADFSQYIKSPELLVTLFRCVPNIRYALPKDERFVSLHELSRMFIQAPHLIVLEVLPILIQNALLRELDQLQSKGRGVKQVRLDMSEFLKELQQDPSLMVSETDEQGNEKSQAAPDHIREYFSAHELTADVASVFPAYAAYDALRLALYEVLGCAGVERAYKFAGDATEASASQGSNAIIHNLHYLSLEVHALAAVLSSDTPNAAEVRRLFERLLALESHERTHNLEDSRSETHGEKFFIGQRRLIDAALSRADYDPEAILWKLRDQFGVGLAERGAVPDAKYLLAYLSANERSAANE